MLRILHFYLLFTLFSLNTNGQSPIWAKSLGGILGQVQVRCNTYDSQGFVYLAGDFYKTCDFDPGPNVANLTDNYSGDGFILKLDTAGNFIWVKHIECGSQAAVMDIALDQSGNVYATGFYYDTCDFDSGAGTINLLSNGINDAFVTKLNSSGKFIWAKTLGGTGGDIGESIFVDQNYNVYSTGEFDDIADFDPGANTFNLSIDSPNYQITAIDWDIYVSKLDSGGNFIWARGMGARGHDQSRALTVDPLGNVITVGRFLDTIDLDPGPANYTLQTGNKGAYGSFISKLDASGQFIWGNIFTGTNSCLASNSQAFGVDADMQGNIYVTGNFAGNVDFQFGPGLLYAPSNYSINYGQFVCKLNPSGYSEWVSPISCMNSNSEALGLSVQVDNSSGNVFSTGRFWGSVDFDRGPGVKLTTSNGHYDIFVHQTDASGNHVWSGYMGSPSRDEGTDLVIGGGYLYSSGHFRDVADFSSGNSTTILSSPVYTNGFVQKIKMQCGLDTSITITSTSLTANLNGANYSWLDCNNSMQPVPGETGQTFIPGNYAIYALRVEINGCVDTSKCVAIGCHLDTSISRTTNFLWASENNATYQWIDCGKNSSAVPGATQQGFAPSMNGNYAVIINKGGCKDTSGCYFVGSLSLKDYRSRYVEVFPNPTKGNFAIRSNVEWSNPEIRIVNILGKKINFSKEISGSSITIDLSTAAKGIYMISLFDGKKYYFNKIIKQ